MRPSQILFLPGAIGDPDFWKPTGACIKTDARKVFVRYPWFGISHGNPLNGSLGDLVGEITGAIDCPTAIVAQSMGGILAIQAALRCPEGVTHLVLAATSGGIPVRKLGGIEWQTEFFRNYPAAPDWIVRNDLDLSSQIRSILIPTLLIWGDADPISPIAVGENLARLLPQGKLQVIADGDHDLARTSTTEVASMIERHLAEDRFYR